MYWNKNYKPQPQQKEEHLIGFHLLWVKMDFMMILVYTKFQMDFTIVIGDT